MTFGNRFKVNAHVGFDHAHGLKVPDLIVYFDLETFMGGFDVTNFFVALA
jgi:hypothetical protein